MEPNNLPLMLVFDIEVFVIVGLFTYALWKGRRSKWFHKSPRFYWAAFIVCILAIIATILSTVFMALPQQVQDGIMLNTPLSVILAKVVYAMFYIPALGIVYAGIKSIKEKQSITLGTSVVFQKPVSGPAAQITGSLYIVIGSIFLLFLIWMGSSVIFIPGDVPQMKLEDALNELENLLELH